VGQESQYEFQTFLRRRCRRVSAPRQCARRRRPFITPLTASPAVITRSRDIMPRQAIRSRVIRSRATHRPAINTTNLPRKLARLRQSHGLNLREHGIAWA